MLNYEPLYINNLNTMNFCQLGLDVIETEAQAILELTQRIDASFDAACRQLLECNGRVVVTGMGKSGHIGKKIAATLNRLADKITDLFK